MKISDTYHFKGPKINSHIQEVSTILITRHFHFDVLLYRSKAISITPIKHIYAVVNTYIVSPVYNNVKIIVNRSVLGEVSVFLRGKNIELRQFYLKAKDFSSSRNYDRWNPKWEDFAARALRDGARESLEPSRERRTLHCKLFRVQKMRDVTYW